DDAPVVGHEHDQQQERGCRESLHDTRPHQSLEWIEAEKIQQHGDGGKYSDGGIELLRLTWPCVKTAVLPAECLTQIVRCAGSHDRNGDEADADNTDREENTRALACERTQGLRGLRCSLDVRSSGFVQGRTG